MKYLKHLLKAIVCLALVAMMVMWFVPAHAVTTERTESTLISNVKNIRAGQKFWAVVHIKLQPGWHTYWKNPGDSGIPPTFTWTVPNGFLTGDIQYLAPERLPVGPLVDYGYNGDAYYFVSITPPAILRENATAILALKAKWLVCNDICIPETADLSIALPATAGTPEPSADGALINDLASKLPASSTHAFGFAVEGSNVHFDMPLHDATANEIKEVSFFPAVEGLITNSAMQQVSIEPGKVSFTIQKADSKLLDAETGVVSFFLAGGTRKDYEVQLQSGIAMASTTTNAGEEQSLIITVLFAFLGGLILNLMPCVFPILSLKALTVAKKAAAHPDVVRLQSIAYTVGVVLSFLVMAATLIIIQKSGSNIGWGYQMQSPAFVSGLAILLFVVGLNLSGYFEFPMLFGNVGSTKASHDSTLGSFLTGVLAVLVATPCTAPFMAPAIGFALTQNAAIVLAVFAALGFGLASPFLLIGLFPACVQILPKPGKWMLTFKQFLAFPMYISAVWLVWVLMHEAGDNTAAIILLSMIIIAFAFWLWRHGHALTKAASVVVVIIGFLSVAAVLRPNTAGEHTLRAHAETFSQTRLEALRAQNIPVFVDATADWCITCKVNETVALSSPEILQAFVEHHVVYMVADWTHGDSSITNYLESFGRRGVPIYVYYPAKAEPQVLPQVLTESIVLKAISQ